MRATDAYTHRRQGGNSVWGRGGEGKSQCPCSPLYETLDSRKPKVFRQLKISCFFFFFMGVWLGSQIHVTHLLLLDAIRLGQTFPTPQLWSLMGNEVPQIISTISFEYRKLTGENLLYFMMWKLHLRGDSLCNYCSSHKGYQCHSQATASAGKLTAATTM